MLRIKYILKVSIADGIELAKQCGKYNYEIDNYQKKKQKDLKK
jgi:hypothetical protein